MAIAAGDLGSAPRQHDAVLLESPARLLSPWGLFYSSDIVAIRAATAERLSATWISRHIAACECRLKEKTKEAGKQAP